MKNLVMRAPVFVGCGDECFRGVDATLSALMMILMSNPG